MTIDFTKRVKANRKYRSVNTQDGDLAPLSQLESDRGRIINSAAIRRLQQKTQVFPLERNAAVRSRLTHSLEVQQVGRFITQLIFKELTPSQQTEYGLAGLERQFESLVEMSCLMHDIGNPPFGHFGEDTMIQWFKQQIDVLYPCFKEANVEGYGRIKALFALKQDICSFEGNAQALRLVHSILALNLTYSQISGIAKYTRRGDQPKPSKDSPYGYIQKKVGYYLSEVQLIEEMQSALKIQEGCRSPFAYVMEAADDISYGVADIEDAVEKGILEVDDLFDVLEHEYKSVCDEFQLNESTLMGKMLEEVKSSFYSLEDPERIKSMFFVGLRVGINKNLPKFAAKRFISNIDSVFSGQFNQALIEDRSEYHAAVETLKNVAKKKAFCAPEVEMQELQGHKIIQGLLEAYAPLLALSRAEFDEVRKDNFSEASGYNLRMFHKLPKKHLRAYKSSIDSLFKFKQHFVETELEWVTDDDWEFYFRCRLIQDYISGMTDQFAYDEYR